MRTARCGGLRVGGLCPGGGSLSWWGVSVHPGVLCHRDLHPAPLPLSTEWHTHVKTLPCPKLRLRAVKNTEDGVTISGHQRTRELLWHRKWNVATEDLKWQEHSNAHFTVFVLKYSDCKFYINHIAVISEIQSKQIAFLEKEEEKRWMTLFRKVPRIEHRDTSHYRH